MSIPVRTPESRQSTGPWQRRVDSADWDAITAEVNEYGGALLPQLLADTETARIRFLYEDDQNFRATVNMGRHRFGEGEYRHFKVPYHDGGQDKPTAILLRYSRGTGTPCTATSTETSSCRCRSSST